MNNEELKISVIIPVYNAGLFVRKAVESALEQPETAEVLLIEDGSPDNSLEECKKLEAESEKVKLFTHPDNANLGAGPTRNVGIENARFEYIAFLDADDVYLPDRFLAERRIFPEQPDIDGVYGALGSHYYNEEGRRRYKNAGYSELTTLSAPIRSGDLFLHFMGFGNVRGWIHLDALTIRKTSLNKHLLFEDLKLHQDSVFIWKLSATRKLVAGDIVNPVGLRGVHDNNRIVNNPSRSGSYVLAYEALYDWAEEQKLDKRYLKIIKCRLEIAKLYSVSIPLRVFTFPLSLTKSGFIKYFLFKKELVWLFIPDSIRSVYLRLKNI